MTRARRSARPVSDRSGDGAPDGDAIAVNPMTGSTSPASRPDPLPDPDDKPTKDPDDWAVDPDDWGADEPDDTTADDPNGKTRDMGDTGMSPMAWRNRIIGDGYEAPDQLLANPLNWRVHPLHQQEKLEGVLSEIGWIQRVIVNRATGHVIDGHARVGLAISRGEPLVPVLYVDLTLEEERLVLATLDPIGALAGTDRQVLDALLAEVSSQGGAVQRLLDDLARDNALADTLHGLPSGDDPFLEPDGVRDLSAGDADGGGGESGQGTTLPPAEGWSVVRLSVPGSTAARYREVLARCAGHEDWERFTALVEAAAGSFR